MYNIALLMLLTLPGLTLAQQEIPLYADTVPNSRPSAAAEQYHSGDNGIARVTNVTVPTLTIYLPPENVTNTGNAVVICPGGGYGVLAIKHEGYDVAEALANQGIAAFVLKYRLPNDDTMMDKSIGPLQDAQRAIQLVRQRATEWKINPNKIGIAGFSAGGHLASSLSTHYGESLIANPQDMSLRPDFSLLVYPVISFSDEITHAGSRHNLLGSEPSVESLIHFSNEKQVTTDTPPAFLVHAQDDSVVPISNSLRYAEALDRLGVTAKLVTYPEGGHGFGLHNPTTQDEWLAHFIGWLAHQ